MENEGNNAINSEHDTAKITKTTPPHFYMQYLANGVGMFPWSVFLQCSVGICELSKLMMK